ncbi:serine/threonine protein kinase [Scytonema hofmannii FACHB-248]|uniref:non-specific serine/threonine protein kinase n=1 Tax=Scytonema hofmannii FACHB-248 TaxID=1842502 RepID=A0ABR8GZI9_9CYAN|nr:MULTISPECIES: serine/threonine-protein kinase [Nostocales]MBD2608435.1 serine/threonine protein kinase [Scytonema hofmannii FACHB-248]
MSFCINPVCPKPNHPDNDENRFCQSCGSQLELLKRYRVLRLLSDKTGFGKVYDAYEQDTPKILKVLKEDLSNDAKVVELFQQEAAVLGNLNHPGIPKVDGYFQYQTRNGLVLHCIVMEKIEGSNLEQWLKQQQNKPISQEQTVAWLKQLLEILALVHGKQYLHRDIKPSNIMIRPDGQLVLIDFGTAREVTRTYLAKISSGGGGITAIMSSGYSAPEQISAQAVAQSDFYALGRTFVFLLTGYHPLEMYDSHHNVLHWQNHAMQISRLLLNLIDSLMVRDVNQRPATAQDIIKQLEAIEQQLTGTIATVNIVGSPKTAFLPQPTTTTLPPQPEKQPEKVPLLALFAALLVSLGLLGLVALATRSSKLASLPEDYGQAPEKKGKVDYFPYEEGKDSQGRVAEFNVAVLSVEYKWQLGSNYQVKYNDELINLDSLKSNLEEEGIQRIMENPSEIISVGTASCEGNVEVEEKRAFERSQKLQLLVKKIFSKTRSVEGYRLLNMGQFQRTDCQANQDSTAYQRSIIIIGVKKQSEGVILDEALRDRLDNKPFADFKLQDYSLGSQKRFKTIPSNL